MSPHESVDDLLGFLAAGTSPYHAVAEVAARLDAAGFTQVDLAEPWSPAGLGYVVRGGAIIAWALPPGTEPWTPFRLVGAHTDSPNLRLKPHPDLHRAGWAQLGVEVYGGALWNSWLDRDLGLSGRLAVADGSDRLREVLVRVDEPLCRIPQLAIHLDRGVNEAGLKLDPQVHLTPVWGAGPAARSDVVAFLAGRAGVRPGQVLGWDVMLHDLTPPSRLGGLGELISAARLDNLVSCWAATTALVGTTTAPEPGRHASVVSLFDHEEVGSTTATGADGALLEHVLERLVSARGGSRDDLLRAYAGSVCASADMAHATHPNYPERHDLAHPVVVGGGPVVKVNASQRYATDATTAAVLVQACERAGVPHQAFVSRNDQPCGSTIGPLTAARLGIATVDVGVPQLSMHSARELCGAEDPIWFARALGAFLQG